MYVHQHLEQRPPEAPRTAPEPAAAPLPLAWLARRPAAQRASVLHALSRTAGNQAVARAVAPPSTGGGGGETEAHVDAASATPEERLQEIPKALASGETAYLVALWDGFGSVPDAAREREALFLQSAAAAPSLWDRFTAEQDAFKRAVEATALEHLSANRDYVAAEMARLSVAGGPVAEPGHEQALERTQALAKRAESALQVKQRLLAITVGLVPVNEDVYTMIPVPFDPKHPTPSVLQEPGDKTWDEVNAQYEDNERLLGNIQASSPGVFALIQGDVAHAATAASDLAHADPNSAAAYLEASLSGLMKSLEDTAAGVRERYSWEQLSLLHPQVLAQAPFTEPLAAGAAQHAKGDHGAEGAVMAAGLLAAMLGVFATGGLAAALAVVGAAASGAQAVTSIGEYERLAELRGARTGDSAHDLVSSETVDESQAQAILDTLFAFLDGVSAVHALKGLGGAEAVAEKLADFGGLATAEKAEVLGAAMESMGEAQALDRVGGIAAVRGELAGTSPARRAEALSTRLEGELAAELGGKEARAAAASEIATGVPVAPPPSPALTADELLQKARQYAAERTGLPPERARGRRAAPRRRRRAGRARRPRGADGERVVVRLRAARHRRGAHPLRAPGHERLGARAQPARPRARDRRPDPLRRRQVVDHLRPQPVERRPRDQCVLGAAAQPRGARAAALRAVHRAGPLHARPGPPDGGGRGARGHQRQGRGGGGPPRPAGRGHGRLRGREDLVRVDPGLRPPAPRRRAGQAGRVQGAEGRAEARARGAGAGAEPADRLGRPLGRGEGPRPRQGSRGVRGGQQIDEVVRRRAPEIEANHGDYLNLPEERDAYRAQAGYADALAARRETEAMRRAEAELRGMLRADPPAPVPAGSPAPWEIHDADGVWQ